MTPSITAFAPPFPSSAKPSPRALTEWLAQYTQEESLNDLLGPCIGDVDPTWWAEALFDPLADYLARPGKSFRSRLVQLCWNAAGGHDSVPSPLPALVEIIHAGSLVIDDIQDEAMSRRGHLALHRQIGTPLAINAGNWLYFWPSLMIEELNLDAEKEKNLRRELGRTMWRCHCGQALDLHRSATTMTYDEVPSIVYASAGLKTGALMAFAAAAPAITLGAKPECVAGFARFGQQLGLALQMLDDLSAVCNEERVGKAHEDFHQDTPTWAWVWAQQSLNKEEFAELQTFAREVRDGLRTAQSLTDKLRPIIEKVGRDAVHHHVQGALADARGAMIDPDPVNKIEREISRLEKAYG